MNVIFCAAAVSSSYSFLDFHARALSAYGLDSLQYVAEEGSDIVDMLIACKETSRALPVIEVVKRALDLIHALEMSP